MMIPKDCQNYPPCRQRFSDVLRKRSFRVTESVTMVFEVI